jgi:hypothetical protein
MARILRRRRRTVSDYCAAGAFPGAFRLGRSWRISRTDFLRAMKHLREPFPREEE